MTQEQLNGDIAQELNKWQPIIEYSRMKLDEDSEVRSDFRWLIWLYRVVPWGIIATVIDGVLSSITSLDILFYILVFLIIAIILIGLTLFCYKKVIKKVMKDSEKQELSSLLDDGVRYLDDLGRMLVNTDPDNKLSKSKVQEIEADYRQLKSATVSKENRFSILNGKIDSQMQEKAQKIADERLKRYQFYI